MDDATLKVRYALERLEGCSVAVIDKSDWLRLVRADGEPTAWVDAPDPFSGVVASVAVAALAGSGIVNRDPGFDIVRVDPRDAPYVYNIDHYQVIEDVTNRCNFDEILRMCDQANNIIPQLKSKVFVIGPQKLDHHWVEEIPVHIAQAKSKQEP